MKWKMMKLHHLFIVTMLTALTLPGFLWAFDDDSTDNTHPLVEIRIICDNGRTVIDSKIIHSSCQGDSVYIDRARNSLFKNDVLIFNRPVLDFKISRNGKVFFRSQNGPFLYDENGKLNSNGGRVILFLVSSSGDVVYQNDRGDVFKNGVQLQRGASRVRVQAINIFFRGIPTRLFLNPAVSRNGKAIYVNEDDNLYVDGQRLNPRVSNTLEFKVNYWGDVYYLDFQDRLFRNTRRLFDGKFNILDFQLSNRGEVAFLTNRSTKNLYLEGRVMTAGAGRVVNFNFNSNGDILYQDDIGRLWKNGTKIADR